MTSPEAEGLTFTRHRLIDSLMEVNQRQLRCESARFGVEIELARLRRDAPGADPVESAHAIAEQTRRQAALDEEQRKLAAERDWLDTTLAELLAADEGHDDDVPDGSRREEDEDPEDGGVPGPGPVGRA